MRLDGLDHVAQPLPCPFGTPGAHPNTMTYCLKSPLDSHKRAMSGGMSAGHRPPVFRLREMKFFMCLRTPVRTTGAKHARRGWPLSARLKREHLAVHGMVIDHQHSGVARPTPHEASAPR
jgi:hypothetical protein